MSAIFRSDSGIFEHIESQNILLGGNIVATQSGKLTIGSFDVPVETNSIGLKGQISFDQNNLYICVENNNWKRLQLQDLGHCILTRHKKAKNYIKSGIFRLAL